MEIPEDTLQLQRLMKEAAFFGLDGLAEVVDAKLKHVVVVASLYSHNFHCSKKKCNMIQHNVMIY